MIPYTTFDINSSYRRNIILKNLNISEEEFDKMGCTKDQFIEKLINNFQNYAKVSYKQFRGEYGISCWNISNIEIEFLWKIYSGQNSGVAIQSTFGLFKEALKEERRDVYIGKVNYDIKPIQENNEFWRYLHKPMAYECEKELRAIIWEKAHVPIKNESIKFQHNNGEYVKIDPNILIQNVVISPFADDWFFDVVNNFVNLFEYNFKITKSSLLDHPFK